MDEITLDDLIRGRDGLDALVRTDPEDEDAQAWRATIRYLNRRIVRLGGTAYNPPDDL